jgi:hypothetical protein
MYECIRRMHECILRIHECIRRMNASLDCMNASLEYINASLECMHTLHPWNAFMHPWASNASMHFRIAKNWWMFTYKISCKRCKEKCADSRSGYCNTRGQGSL